MTIAAATPSDQRVATEDEQPPSLCVSLITYNQRKFIAEAIDGALMQKTDFPVTIHIGDDCSTDGTRDILRRYRDRHPGRIVLDLRDEKGAGRPGRENNMATLGSCQSKYIAMLDGDDYWIDEGKLQHQVDFLERSPAHSCIGHAVRLFDQETATFGTRSEREVIARLVGRRFARATHIDLGQRELFQYIPQTSTLCFRAAALPPFPSWFRDITAADRAIVMMLAGFGPVRVDPRVMSVYRIHPSSEWQLTERLPRRQWLDWQLSNYESILAAFHVADQGRNKAQLDVLRGQRAWLDGLRGQAVTHLARAAFRDPLGVLTSATRLFSRRVKRL